MRRRRPAPEPTGLSMELRVFLAAGYEAVGAPDWEGNWLVAYEPEAVLRAAWLEHRAEIDAEARRRGRTRAWAAEQFDREQENSSAEA